jgi:hypothetical protein
MAGASGAGSRRVSLVGVLERAARVRPDSSAGAVLVGVTVGVAAAMVRNDVAASHTLCQVSAQLRASTQTLTNQSGPSPGHLLNRRVADQ